MKNKKALIAMSGGVDSSVTAALIKDAGFDCVGATMSLLTDAGTAAQDARECAQKLGFEHTVFDFHDIFEREVVSRFICAYENGLTPNPCVYCNRYIKFSALYTQAEKLGCDFIATGHYARIEQCGGRYILKKALDESKDQSYVLYSLSQQTLAHTLLPLGNLHKETVREIADRLGFANANKPDSQDICFVPDGDYAGFIERYTGKTSRTGAFLNTAGEPIGTHRGVIHYTIGQRKGLGISAPHPLYVCGICPEQNTVTLGGSQDLFSRRLTATDVNLISCDSLEKPVRVQAKIRYRHPEQPATAWCTPDGVLHVEFDEPQRAITCGQAVVLYDGETVVGGGRISSAEKE